MELKDKIKIYLDQIKKIKGVENVVLTQRDGNPIQSSGVWLSQEEIFSVCSATSAIFNVGIKLYPEELQYILIEGKKAKILIAPLNSPVHETLNRILTLQEIIKKNKEFFIAITALPTVNLGSIFLQTNTCLKKVKNSLLTSKKEFKPPLIEFTGDKLQEILERFKIKDRNEENYNFSSFSLNISEDMTWELNKLLNNFSRTILDLNYAFLTVEGGFILSQILKSEEIEDDSIDSISAMSYSLFQVANRCSWLLKKMEAEKILLDTQNSFQFINKVHRGVFCSEIAKGGKMRLGLIRLYIPQFLKKASEILKKASEREKMKSFDIKNLLGEMIIK